MDRSAAQQTSVSSLFAYLVTQQVMSTTQMQKGFQRLIEALPDLKLDVPAAATILDTFIQKAKADKCLPADFEIPTPPSTTQNGSAAAAAAATPPAAPQPDSEECSRLLAVGAQALKK